MLISWSAAARRSPPFIWNGEVEFEKTVRCLSRLAATLGCKLVRVFTGYSRANVGYDQAWNWCVESLKESSRRTADFGVTIALQNHHDTAAHFESFADLLDDVDEPNCCAAFDAWSPALHGSDLVAAVKRLGSRIVHTTVADYVRRPRFSYVPNLVNYVAEPDAIRHTNSKLGRSQRSLGCSR